MEFFEFPQPQPEPQRERPARPPWAGPPENVLPGVVALELVLARSELAAVCISRLEAYETGFGLEVLALASSDVEGLDPRLIGPHRAPMGGRALGSRHVPEPYPPPELLRFGVQFADGRKATNITSMPFGRGRSAHLMAAHSRDPEAPPAGPVLTSHGGSGGDRRWRQQMWVWPLPPPGTLALVCEWPAAEIPLTRQEMDAAELIEASERAQAVFPASPH